MKRKLLALLLTLLTVLGMFPATALAASSEEEALGEIDIYSDGTALDYLSINGAARSQKYTYYNFTDKDGNINEIPCYCVNPNTAGVPQTVPAGTGIEYLANQKCTDTKVLGIVASGYPHVALDKLGLNSKYEAYYATKMALWCHLLSNWSVYDLKVNPGCSDQAAAQRVLKAAKDIYQTGMYWTKPLSPKLTATPDQPNPYPVTIDGKGYMQQVYQVVSETWVDGGWLHVQFADSSSVPTGTRIIDKDGNDCTQISCMESTGNGFAGQFTILIPQESMEEGDGSVQVEISGIGHNYAIFYATCAETDKYGNLQKYMADTDPRHPIKVDVIASYSKNPPPPDNPPPENPPPEITPPGDLLIIKRDAGTLDLLDGAIFEVVGPNGDTIGSFSSVGGEVSVPNLEPGNYTVYERVPPKYYLLSDEPARNVTVKTGETATLTYDNEPFGSLRIEKVSDTGDRLPGVTIQIKHIESGRTYTGQTEESGAIEFTELKPGAYEVREIAGIKGWQLDPDSVKTVTVVTGETSTVTFVNKELPGLRIIKYDSSNKEVLSGVTFEIWRDGESLGSFETGELGEILLTGLTPGTYVVQEKFVGDEHIIDSTPQQVELRAGDGIKQLVFYNDKKPGMKLVKVDASDPSRVIPNAKFEIKSVDGSFGPEEYITDEHGEIDLSKLPPGAYVVTEISCPGYIIDEAQRIIQLDGNETARFVFTNHIKPSLRLIKKSSDGSPLGGVHFRIAKIEDGTRYLDRITNDQGEILISDLEPGVYSVRETATTSNHIIDIREYHVELFPGKTSEITIENQKRPNLIVYKHDADTGEPIPNTVFTVRAADGHSVDEIKTDANGRAELKNLLPGVYEVSEKSVPAPWLQDAPAQMVTLYPNRDHTLYFKNHKKPTLTVNKVDSVTGSPIKGAKFEVWYGSNNTTTGELNSLGTYFSDANGQFILDLLRDGWYKVTELEPAAGFTIKEPATQEFYIKGGESKTITFENVPLNAIAVEKYDSVTGEALPGCTFQLRYLAGASGTGGNVIGTKVTGKNGTALWTGLKPGTYILEEVDPADGYSIIQSSETILLADNGEQSVVTVRFTNAPDGMLLIRKVCSVNPSVTLQNAEFKIIYADGTVIGDSNGIFRTDENGEIRITGLKPGKSVVVTETQAPAGFILDTQSQTVQVKEGKTVSLTFKNQPKGAIIVQKRDSDTNAPLPGAEFRITTAAGCEVGLDGVIGTSTLTSNGIFTTDAQGEIRITNLAPGAYVLTEIKAPAGYVMDSPSTNVVIGANGDTQTVIVTNTKKGGLIIEKYDSVTRQPLVGAQFKVTTASGELVPDNEGLTSSNGLYTTDRNGQIVLSKLLPGTYVVAEEKAPDNYRKDPTPQTVVVNAGDTQTLRFYDDPLCTLTILKRDAVTKKPLAGAAFTVRDSEGKAVGPNNGSYVTGSDGTATVTGLEPNATIVVSESKAPTGYILDQTPKNIVVRSGAANSLTFDNEPATTLIIQKFIEGTENEPLSGVAFKVTDGSGAAVGPDDGTYYTDKAGEIVLSGLEPGTTVKAREIKTVEGFVLDGTPQDILIKGGEVQRLTFWNKRDNSLTILKQSTDKTPLTGAIFHVTDEDGAAIGTNNGRYTSDRNGLITITGLQPGQILIVTEEKAPNGYVRDMTPKTIKIKQGVANSLIFENARAGSLVINKRSSVDKKTPLEGVTFKITTTSGEFLPDENGKISSNGLYYTDENGQIILNGIVGTLVITEQQTIDGYTIHEANRTQTVEVKPDDTQTLYFYNDPLCSLTITKVDSVTGKPVPNTEFTVKYSNGVLIGKYTTGKDGTVTVTGLQPGSTVVVTETKVPNGYVLNPTPQIIVVNNGTGNSLTSGSGSTGSGSGTGGNGGNNLDFENDPTTTLTIQKFVDGTENQPLKGVEFLVTDGTGAVVGPNNGYYTTDKDGRITIPNLEPGTTITARETKTLDGYILNPTPQTITIKTGEGQTMTFWNKKAGGLIVNKVDALTKKPLAGVKFKITYADGRNVDMDGGKISSNGLYTTDALGQIKILGITGTVIVEEIETLPGYTIDPNTRSQTVVVNANDTQTLTFINASVGGLELIKVSSSDKSRRITGVTFEIRKMDGALVNTVTTGDNGRVHVPLDAGDYYAVEIEAADGFKIDSTPHYFTIKDNETTTLTVTNAPFSGIIIHKVNSVTGEGIYDVKFLLYDQNKNPIGEYSTDNEGYIYIDDLTVQGKGKLFIRELEAAPGYELDKEYKTIYVQPGKTVEIEWKNVPITGQFQVYKYAAEYNEVTGTPAGAPLKGAVYEISEVRSGKVVDYITTDARGVAASKPLPLGRYKIVEVTAPPYWKLSGTAFDETLEYSGQIIKVSDYDKPSNLGVTITKRGNAEVLAGSQMRYDFTVANTSNVPLENFFWHDRIPTDAATAMLLTTGTYSARLNYRILYKTSSGGDYQVLASNLASTSSYAFNLNAIPTQAGEKVTEIYFDFGKVPVGFQSTTSPTLSVVVSGNIANGYQLINRADAGGKYQGTWQTAQGYWVTIVRKLNTSTPKLPKTGY